ncbi:HNH endonuclease family protein [Streptomyces anulatus]|uniref:HNH endonuclease family protein n=1 Tax=Streptomyces anulatus TaxID=1892 RepID=UPI001C2755E8|nr:HNH endonuclease family protein [Streptomyces anulatus]
MKIPLTAAGTLLAVAAFGCTPHLPDSSASPTGPQGTTSHAGGSALSALKELPVKGRAPRSGYDRTGKFGAAWSDATIAPGSRNSCDTRNDVLIRDLRDVRFRGGSRCTVASGTLPDPYTGQSVTFIRGPRTSLAVQVDHVVALSDAWQTGAQALTQQQREALANDPLELVAASGPANNQKSDANAASWLPVNKAFRCSYVARQIAVKAKYRLWITTAERTSMARVLNICPGQQLPHDNSQGVALNTPK